MAFTICSAGLLWAVPMTNTTGDGFEDYNSVHKDKSTLRVEISTSLITFQDRLVVQGVTDLNACPCCSKGKMHFFAEIPRGRARPPSHLVCLVG
jgi:hypothetical protein